MGRTKQIKAEFEAQAKIAKLEVDLDAARQKLFRLRRAVYGGEPEQRKKTPRGPAAPQPTVPRGGAAPRVPTRGSPVAARGGAPQRGVAAPRPQPVPRGAPRGRGY